MNSWATRIPAVLRRNRPEQSGNLLEDSLWSLLLRLSPPGILSMAMVSLNALLDAVYLGQFVGAEALAGVSLLLPLTTLLASVVGWIATGAASVLSRALGAGDSSLAGKIFNQVLFLSLLASGLLMGLGYGFSDSLVGLMGGNGEALGYGKDYLMVWLGGSFFTIFGMASNALIRSEGKMKKATVFAGISVLVDCLLTPLLVQGLGWGVRGTALSTVLSMAVYALLTGLYFVHKKPAYSLDKIRVQVHPSILRPILAIGLSAFVMQSTNFVRQLFIFQSMAYYASPAQLAFFSAVFRIFSFALIPVFGVLQALQPVAGVNFGAKNYQRSIQAVQVFSWGGIAVLLPVWLPTILFPQLALSVLLPDTAFSAHDLANFRWVMLSLPFTPLASTGIVFFQATGQAKRASLLTFGRQAFLFIPLILLLPRFFAVDGIYYCLALENTLWILIVCGVKMRAFSQLSRY
jgi:putative MATE family efflux protein